MPYRKVLVGVLFFLIVFICYRCAQVVPLTGGAKDTTPPELISVIPSNRSTNVPVKNSTIIFKFNEMVTLQNLSQKMIINPLTSEMPEVVASGKTVIVKFEKELQPNTTYFLQLGNAVVDLHENNPYADLSYIFSTGPLIDSAYITGKAIYSLSQKPVPEISVMLYKNLADSVPLVGKPDYSTRTNDKGEYFLSAVKPGRYKVIAFDDKNKNQQYDLAEAMDFVAKPVEIDHDTVDFEISTPETEKVFIKKKLQAFWGYNKYVLNDTFPNSYIITEKSIDADKYAYETRNDTLEVYYRDLYARKFEFMLKNEQLTFDTITLNIPAKTAVDSSIEKGLKKVSMRSEKSTYGAKHDDVVLNFSIPVKGISADKCVLLWGKESTVPVFAKERANEENSLVTTFLPQYKQRLLNVLMPQNTYTLMLLPGSVETFWGVRNGDTLRMSFKTFSEDDIGSAQVKLALADSIKSYVLQLLNAKNAVVREASGANKKDITHSFYNLPAGDYSLRLIDDRDQNGKFSPVSYQKKLAAEKVIFYDKPVKIPAGWDVEVNWSKKK
jgi:uncharacterized protein (DUF2141 family)